LRACQYGRYRFGRQAVFADQRRLSGFGPVQGLSLRDTPPTNVAVGGLPRGAGLSPFQTSATIVFGDGGYVSKSLILNWNGTRWTRVNSPY
jgi:hypothetical protein